MMRAFDSRTFHRIKNNDRWQLTAALVTVGLIALISRFWSLGETSLWLDEAWSWRMAKQPFGDMLDLTATIDNHPPLLYALLHAWIRVFNDSEFALRAPSAVASAASVVLIAYAGWRIRGPLLGLTAATLLLFNGVHLEYGQEARMYPFAGLFALAATIALSTLVRRPSVGTVVCYAVPATALIYTHYTGMLVLASHALLMLTFATLALVRDRNARVGVACLAAVALVAAAYAPWYGNFRDTSDRGTYALSAPDWNQFGVVMKPAFGLAEAGHAWWLLAIPLLAFAIVGATRKMRDPLVVGLCALACMPVAQWATSCLYEPPSGRGEAFTLRQITPFIPALAFVLALGVNEAFGLARNAAGYRRSGALALTGAATAALAVITLVGVISWYRDGRRDDWRQLAEDIDATSAPVYAWRPYMDVPLDYYLPDDAVVRPIESLALVGDGFAPIPRNDPGARAYLALGHHSAAEEELLMRAIGPYFHTDAYNDYAGSPALYTLSAISTAEYNVELFRPNEGGVWATNARGALVTDDESYFRPRFDVATDADGGTLTIHAEYLDAGAPSFSVGAVDRNFEFSELGRVDIEGSGDWRSIDIPLMTTDPRVNVFLLSPGVTVRALEIRRYDLTGAALFRERSAELRQWFLRPDGYLQPITPTVCVWPTLPLSPKRQLALEISYRSQDGTWADLTRDIPAAAEPVCSIPVPASAIRRIVVRESGTP